MKKTNGECQQWDKEKIPDEMLTYTQKEKQYDDSSCSQKILEWNVNVKLEMTECFDEKVLTSMEHYCVLVVDTKS